MPGIERGSAAHTVNIAVEFPSLKIANVRNPNPIPYAEAAYDPLRRPFHKPTMHRPDGTFLGDASSSYGFRSTFASTSPNNTSHSTATHHGQLQLTSSDSPGASRVRQRLEHATASPLALRYGDDDEDGGHAVSTMTRSRSRPVTSNSIDPLYGDKHQAQCQYCQAAAFDAARRLIVTLMREQRAARSELAADEVSVRAELQKLFEPLHRRHLRTVARWLEHLDRAGDAAHLRMAIDATVEDEAAERAAMVRDALRTQRALFRCMARAGAGAIEAAEATVRAELLLEQAAAVERAAQRAADRAAFANTLRERAGLLQAGEERRRVQLGSEEFRDATRLLLLERERRERVAYDVQRRREIAAAAERLSVEKAQESARAAAAASESEARTELRAVINATQSELRAALHARRRQDVTRREELGRRLKGAALLQDLASLLIVRIAPAMELEARSFIRETEAAARAALLLVAAASREAKSSAAAGADEDSAAAGHAAAAKELVSAIFDAASVREAAAAS